MKKIFVLLLILIVLPIAVLAGPPGFRPSPSKDIQAKDLTVTGSALIGQTYLREKPDNPGTFQISANGTDWSDWQAGVDGNTILSGTGEPAAGLGVNGNYYVDTTTPGEPVWYGPKAAGAWGTGYTLKGDTGNPGADGEEVSLQVTATHVQTRLGSGAWADLIALSTITGPQGEQGEQGEQGLPGEDGADGEGFQPCAVGDGDCGVEFPCNTLAVASWPAPTLDGEIRCFDNSGIQEYYHYVDGVWVEIGTGTGSMTYPGAGVPQSTGSAWDTSLSLVTTVGEPGSDTAIPTEQAVREAIVAGASGYVAAPTYSDDTCTTGQWSFDASYHYICVDTDTWDRYAVTFASWSAPTPTPPTISSVAIGTGGLVWTLTASEALTSSTGGRGGMAGTCATAGAITLTYSTGNESATLEYTGDPIVYAEDTCTLAYTQPGDGWEDGDGDELATFTGKATTNNSTEEEGGFACTCSGDLLFCWSAESTTVTSGTPAGCSVGDTTATANSIVELSDAQAKDGTYSLYVPTSSDRYVFDVSSEDIVKGEVGRTDGWFYIPTSIAEVRELVVFYADALNYITVLVRANGTLRIMYRSDGTDVSCTTSATASADTWTYYSASWSVAGESGNYLRVGFNTTGETPSYTNCSDSISDMGSPTTISYGDRMQGTGGQYIDSVRVYGAW